jgi:hypothetical protein
VFSAGKDRIVSPLVIIDHLLNNNWQLANFYCINQDVDWLETQLGNLKGSIRIPYYDHIDFIWVIDSILLVWKSSQ